MPLGFKGFAKERKLDADTKKAALENLASDEYVLFTGGKYARRRASGRSKSLATITEKGKPITLRTYAERAFKIGFSTDISVGGLGLHQGAKPAVYLYLVKDAEGNFRAKKAIPSPDRAFSKTGFEAGAIVVPAKPKKEKAVAKADETK